MHYPLSIDIVYPSEKDKWNVADLWQESFDDSPEYVEFFFNHVYKPENTLVVKRDGFIVSALQMIPYKAMWCKKVMEVAYVCGACTHRFSRGHGFMKALVRHAKIEMKRRGFDFAVVIPAEPSLFDFYEKLGFTKKIFHQTQILPYNKHLVTTLESRYPFTFEECTAKHFPYFERKQQERYRTIIHDRDEFETILQELKCNGGQSFVALENNIPAGMAFAEKISKDTIHVKDIMTDSKRIFNAIYRYAFKLFDAQYIKINSPRIIDKKSSEYGLACSLDRKDRKFYFFHMSLMHD